MEFPSVLLFLGLAVAAQALWQFYQWVALPSGVRKSLVLPKPKGTLPLLGNTLQTACRYENIHDWFLEQRELHGGRPVLATMIDRPHQIAVMVPEFFEDINKTHFDAFEKGPMFAEIMHDVLDDGIFAVDGDRWQHQRKTMSHLFSLRGLRDNFAKSAHTNAVKFYKFLEDTIAKREHRWLNVGVEKELKDAGAVIDKTNRNANKDAVNKKKDIVSLFIDSFDCNNPNEVFDPVALRDMVVSILAAGRNSTASTLGWFFYRLSKHPDVEYKIRKELLEQAPALMRGEVAALSMEESQKLPYLEATLRKTLRLHPAVPVNIRHANRDVVLHDGTFVATGWNVIYLSYTMAHMESVWGPDAKEFKPER
uniref:Cytochrome P450 n=1 Tax=Globisporangium ultimum (strain ATCC 200006 / CBS 805.95 / DAOM BR144) TaxID=431595 RepID=K3WMH5_GLOUD